MTVAFSLRHFFKYHFVHKGMRLHCMNFPIFVRLPVVSLHFLTYLLHGDFSHREVKRAKCFGSATEASSLKGCNFFAFFSLLCKWIGS